MERLANREMPTRTAARGQAPQIRRVGKPGPETIIPVADGGMDYTPREVAFGKLGAPAQGAAIGGNGLAGR